MGWGLAAVAWSSDALSQAPLGWGEGQILVQPRAGLSEAKFNQILERSNGRAKAKIGSLNVHIVQVPPQGEQAVARALSRNPHIEFAEVDAAVEPGAFIPNDPLFPNQWHLSQIQAPNAWDFTQGEGITVAVLDSGIDPNHPDLQGQLVGGWNVVSHNTDTADWQEHGTSVAGALGAATHNANQVAGVAGQVRLMPIRINNPPSNFANYSDIAAGLTWAADHGAKVANISYGPINSSTVNSAANYFRSKGGVVFTIAANNGTDPGISENPSLIVVSATDQSDVRTSWSNYGDFVDVAAPGIDIVTTRTGGSTWWAYGTSLASPIAAGVAALIMASDPALTPPEVETILEDSADNIGSAYYYGAGRVNAAQAVQLAGGSSGGNDTESPFVTITNPARDAIVIDWVPVDVEATDNEGVTRVVLYAGSTLVGEDTTAPFQFSWDSTSVADGPTTLMAYAYDAANNEGSSGSHPIEVDNVQDPIDTTPPTVSIQQPTPNSTVNGHVQVSVPAADNVGLQTISLYINGQLKSSTDVSPLSYSWNTNRESDGTHTLKAVAVDDAGLSSEHQIQVIVGTSNSLSVTVSGAGSVTSSPSGLNCSSGTCTANFASGSSVTLTATPGSGAVFSGWGGACGGSSVTCTVTMSTAQSVTATFTTSAPPSSGGIQVNFQPSGASVPSGYVKDDGSGYSSSRGYGWSGNLTGNTRERAVQADQRLDTFVFVGPTTPVTWQYDLPSGDYVVALASGDPSWSQGPQRVVVEGQVVIQDQTSGPNSYLTVENLPVTITDGALTVTVGGSSGNTLLNYLHVIPVTTSSQTLAVTVSGAGSVTSSPSGLNCSSGTCTANFASGSSVTLTATPGSGAVFSGWGGACGGSSVTCTVTMSTAQSVTATFTTSTPETEVLSVTISGAGSVTSSPSGLNCSSGTCTANFASGSSVTLTATPGSGAVFSGWGGACGGSSVTCTVTMSTAQSVTATFTTSAPPSSGGIQVNFQPSGASVPSGYVKDDGSGYSSSRGYGWSGNLTGNTRERAVQADQRLDTFVFVGPTTPVTWQYDLPNGDYVVALASGDPSWSQGPQRVVVEGQVVIQDQTSGPNSYLTVENLPVTITDGALTVTVGGSSGNTLLNYLHVIPVTTSSQTLAVTVSGAGSVTSSPSGLNCSSGTCTANFASGSSVTLTATPGSGAVFSGWGGACGGSSVTCTVTMSTAQSVTATFTTSAPPSSGGIQVNFQPSGASVPSGYVKDDGSGYSSSRGYGWSGNLTGNTRERAVQADQRLDTFVFVGPTTPVTWQYDLPSGDYVVALASGDPSWSQGPQRVVVEGQVVIQDQTSGPNSYLTVENLPVTITDGALTVTVGGSSGNTILNYVHITPLQ